MANRPNNSAAATMQLILDRLAAIDASRREIAGERYTDKEVLLKAVQVVGEDISPSGFKRPLIEINGEQKAVPFHRSATLGAASYDLVVQTAPAAFKYLDRAGNSVEVPAGTERYVLKNAA